jgi:hypothetical protein
MKRFILILAIAALVGIMAIGCSKKTPTETDTTGTVMSDNEAVTQVLNVSEYANTDNYGDDGSASMNSKDLFDTTYQWKRRITSETRHVDIHFDSTDFATATITRTFTGRLVVRHSGVPNDTLSRPINDIGARYVWFRKIHNRWRVWGASPMEIHTVSPSVAVNIDSMKVDGGLQPVVFRNGLYNQTRRREEMPTFNPGATATVTVWASLTPGASPDSCWAFMHRRGWMGGVPRHIRQPMDRASTFVFTKTWTIAGSDDPFSRPVVRHSCVDVLLGSSLFGDNTAEYSSRMWTLPFIVKAANDSIPE